MTAQEKINAVLQHYSLGSVEMAKLTGLKHSRISDLSRGRCKKISAEVAAAIVSEFSDISERWLLYGEGEMLVTSVETESGKTESIANIDTRINELLTITTNIYSMFSKANDRLEKSQEQFDKAQAQLDRMLRIVENMMYSNGNMAAEEDASYYNHLKKAENG